MCVCVSVWVCRSVWWWEMVPTLISYCTFFGRQSRCLAVSLSRGLAVSSSRGLVVSVLRTPSDWPWACLTISVVAIIDWSNLFQWLMSLKKNVNSYNPTLLTNLLLTYFTYFLLTLLLTYFLTDLTYFYLTLSLTSLLLFSFLRWCNVFVWFLFTEFQDGGRVVSFFFVVVVVVVVEIVVGFDFKKIKMAAVVEAIAWRSNEWTRHNGATDEKKSRS